jgi:hypothetical protein
MIGQKTRPDNKLASSFPLQDSLQKGGKEAPPGRLVLPGQLAESPKGPAGSRRRPPFQEGKDPMAEEVSGNSQVLVGRVLEGTEAGSVGVFLEFLTGEGKEWPIDAWSPAGWDPSQPRQPGAPQDPEKNGFRLVIGMVAREEQVPALRLQNTQEERVADLPGFGFGRRRGRGPGGSEGDAPGPADSLYPESFLFTPGPHGMVEVGRDEGHREGFAGEPEEVEEGQGVQAP